MTDILNIDDVAKLLGIAKSGVYNLAKEGKIPAFKIAGTWRFSRQTVEKWVGEQSMKNLKGSNERR